MQLQSLAKLCLPPPRPEQKAVIGTVSDAADAVASSKVGKAVSTAADAMTSVVDDIGARIGIGAATEVAEQATVQTAKIQAAEEAAQTVVKNSRNANLLAEGASFIGDATVSKRTTRNSQKLMSNLSSAVQNLGVVDDKVAKVLTNANVEVANGMSQVLANVATNTAKTGAVGATDNVIIAASKKFTGF